MACGSVRRFQAKKIIDMERFIHVKIILHGKEKHREKAKRSTDSIIHEDMCFIVKCFFTAEVVESKCIRLCTPNDQVHWMQVGKLA